MNAAQHQLLVDTTARHRRHGWSIVESTVVPASANLLGAHRDVAVVLSDTGNGYRYALCATDMFAGGGGCFDDIDTALDWYRSVAGDHAASQATLF